MLRSLCVSVLMMLLAPLSARADVPMAGTFVASTACPAVQSIRKGSNPGGVMLTPQRSYRLVSANNTPATHYLLIVPGAQPDRRWVAIGCGTASAAGLASSTTATAASPAATPAPNPAATAATPSSPVAATYVLAISWEPGFCAGAGMGNKPECRAETASGFDASHFTLHGLWRDPQAQFSYCGADGARYKSADRPGNWSALPAVTLDPSVRARLDEDMPGTQSLLERHEWIEHGTCSGASMNDYFGRATALIDEINRSSLHTLVAGRVGQAVSLDDLRFAFEQAFGAGAGQRIRVSCTGRGSDRLVTQITVGLAGDVMGGTKLADLIAAAQPTDGGCEGGTIKAPG